METATYRDSKDRTVIISYCGDCTHKVGPVDIPQEGDSGTIRNPEPFTYIRKQFVCSKYNTILEQEVEWQLLEFVNVNDRPYKCFECIHNRK